MLLPAHLANCLLGDDLQNAPAPGDAASAQYTDLAPAERTFGMLISLEECTFKIC